MSELIRIATQDGVARVTLHRPDAANTIDVAMADAFLQAATKVADDDSVSAVVLTGAGRFFCAGGDIAAFAADLPNAGATITRITTPLHAGIVIMATMDKPLITYVNGPAAGAGIGIALLGDVVIASSSAHFTSAYTAIGLSPDAATSWLLPRMIGVRRAQEMILTNRKVSAAEALAWGMINAVCEPRDADSELGAWIDRLRPAPATSLGASRRLLLDAGRKGLADHLEQEALNIAGLASSKTSQTRIAAFLRK